MHLSELIQKAKALGFEPEKNASGKSLHVRVCPECKRKAAMIFHKGDFVVAACTCGFRKSKKTAEKPCQCKAFTKRGKRCAYKAKKGSDYCGIHGSD